MRPSRMSSTAIAATLVVALVACAPIRRRRGVEGETSSIASAPSAPTANEPVANTPTASQPPTLAEPEVPASTQPGKRASAEPEMNTPAQPASVPVEAPREQAAGYTMDGFGVYEDDGHLWVFREGSKYLADFLEKGPLAERVTLIGAGPGGRTLYGGDTDAVRDYGLAARNQVDGFVVIPADGRLWVFEVGGKGLEAYRKEGLPAERVTKVGAGPEGVTLYGADLAELDAYAAATKYAIPGFAVSSRDGRLWVFKRGSAAHKEFLENGPPAERASMIGAGPDHKTLLGAELDVLADYSASWRYRAPGFVVVGDDGRLWVFRKGSDGLAAFLKEGPPAERVTLIGRGPEGKTLYGADMATLQAYAGAMRE